MTSEELAEKYGMLSVGEVTLIKLCMNRLNPNPLVINIGAGVGTSPLAMLEARPDAFIFSIDTKPKSIERINLAAGGVDVSRILRILSDSAVAGRNWPYLIDLVFIDGDHTDKGVSEDIRYWIPLIVDGGIAIFHDYKHRNLPNLTGIVDRAMQKHEYIGEERYAVAFTIHNDKN